mmetsp:Transcript_47039/g.112064  ORF Transcript_47039/g.112064 Transcript_47039/m.112064 type:complete len:210 (-) Transcript_47039:360-989(-)
MCRPSRENRTSAMEEMISEKKERREGSSSSSNALAWVSQSARSRVSAILIEPREFDHRNRLQWSGWHDAAVITSVSSSMLSGLMSTMLNEVSETPRFHRLIRRSSAEMNVSQSELREMELMWYACPLENTRRWCAWMPLGVVRGGIASPFDPLPVMPLRYVEMTSAGLWSCTFQSLIVLSLVVSIMNAEFSGRHQRRQLIFSSISRDLR